MLSKCLNNFCFLIFIHFTGSPWRFFYFILLSLLTWKNCSILHPLVKNIKNDTKQFGFDCTCYHFKYKHPFRFVYLFSLFPFLHLQTCILQSDFKVEILFVCNICPSTSRSSLLFLEVNKAVNLVNFIAHTSKLQAQHITAH